MFPSRITYLLFASLLLGGCAPAYKGLIQVEGDAHCIQQLVPDYDAVWYRTQVDVYGKHISGLLLIKAMPDSTTRVLFTNEAGVTFFDFEFGPDGFRVKRVIEQLDKTAVVRTLQKDFELLLMKQAMKGSFKQFARDNVLYHAFAQEKEINYFVTDKECRSLVRIEQASKRKKKVELRFSTAASQPVPDSVAIEHFLFNMQIHLKRLPH